MFVFFSFYSTWTPSFPPLLESNPLNGDTFHSVTLSVAVSDEEEEPKFSFSRHVNSAGAACSHLNSAAITRLATPALSRLAGLADDSRYSGCNRGVKDRITRPRQRSTLIPVFECCKEIQILYIYIFNPLSNANFCATLAD